MPDSLPFAEASMGAYFTKSYQPSKPLSKRYVSDLYAIPADPPMDKNPEAKLNIQNERLIEVLQVQPWDCGGDQRNLVGHLGGSQPSSLAELHPAEPLRGPNPDLDMKEEGRPWITYCTIFKPIGRTGGVVSLVTLLVIIAMSSQ